MDNGEADWPKKVKKVYELLLKDLHLSADTVPLFAGEVVGTEFGSPVALNNAVINKLPEEVPTAHIIPSNGCEPQDDKMHFTANSYRIMGKRYAYEVLRTMGRDIVVDPSYNLPDNLRGLYTLNSLNEAEKLQLRVGLSKQLTLWGTFADGHQEDLSNESVFSSNDFNLDGRIITADSGKEGTVTATYTDFFGQEHTMNFTIEALDLGPNRHLAVENGEAGENLWERQCNTIPVHPLTTGKTYTLKATIKADNCNGIIWPILSKPKSEGPNDIQYLDYFVPTPLFQEYSWEFKAEYDLEILQFEFGRIGGKVCFDDVSLKETGTDEELIVNGDFEKDDLSKWVVVEGVQTMTIEDENGTTAIQDQKVVTVSNDVTYDLSGRRVKNPSKGVYIRNNKLFIIK